MSLSYSFFVHFPFIKTVTDVPALANITCVGNGRLSLPKGTVGSNSNSNDHSTTEKQVTSPSSVQKNYMQSTI